MSNRVTLDQIATLPLQEITSLPVEQLAMLAEDMAKRKEEVRTTELKLRSAISGRYSMAAATLRKSSGQDTGTVHITENGWDITCNLPKDVDWDQQKLKVAVDTIARQGEPIEQYVNIKYAVPESRYKAWPASLQAIFAPARVVGTGTEVFKFAKDEK